MIFNRTGQDRTGQDNNASRQKGGSMNTFHDLMFVVQEKSGGKLPHSIVHFMEQTLSEKTQQHLLKSVNAGKLSVEDIIKAMVDAGIEANHGSIEPVDDYIKRKLI